MVTSVGDWVGEITTTTGTGNITLGGPMPGFTTFESIGDPNGVSNANQFYYGIVDGDNREAGIGTISGNILIRTTIHATIVDNVYNDIGPTPISLSGQAEVYSTLNKKAFDDLLLLNGDLQIWRDEGLAARDATIASAAEALNSSEASELSAAAASNSASSAATSSTEASNSAIASADSATIAEGHATSASTSAVQADTSAVASQTARTAAEAARDEAEAAASGVGTASSVPFDNTGTNYTAVDVQAALEEVEDDIVAVNSSLATTNNTVSANASRTPGRKNLIINGGFQVWQRGTSQTTAGYGSDDRWSNSHSGSTKTHSRQAFASGQTAVPGNPAFFSRTVVNSVAAAGSFVTKITRIEGVRTGSGQSVTVSFYAKADATKNASIELLQYFGAGGSPSAAVVGIGAQLISLTTVWKRFEVTIQVPSIEGKGIGTDGGDYIGFAIWFDAGSSFNARTANLGQQSGTFDIAQVQLEIGSTATEFEYRPYAEELALCQRYYEQGMFFHVGITASGNMGSTVFYSVVKRATPSITQVNISNGGCSATPQLASQGPSGFLSYRAGANGSVLTNAQFNETWTADAEL